MLIGTRALPGGVDGVPGTSVLFLRAFKRWRGLKPEVYPTCLDGQPAVIKDYRRYRRTSLAQVARLLVERFEGERERIVIRCFRRQASAGGPG